MRRMMTEQSEVIRGIRAIGSLFPLHQVQSQVLLRM
jgi:hypothetical protein